MSDTATFKATFPPIQSAIKIYGDNSGMRVQFDIPEIEMAEAAKLLLMRNRRLVVTVETLTDLDDETEKKAKGSSDTVDYRRASVERD